MVVSVQDFIKQEYALLPVDKKKEFSNAFRQRIIFNTESVKPKLKKPKRSKRLFSTKVKRPKMTKKPKRRKA